MRHCQGLLLTSLAATTVAVGCASQAPEAPDPPEAPPDVATSHAALSIAPEEPRPQPSEEDLAQRRKIAESGRYVLKAAAGDVAIATPATMLAALDLPGALAPTVVSYTGPATAATDRTAYGNITPRRGTSFLLMSTGVATTDTAFSEPGTDHAPAGVGGDAATFIFRVTVPAGLTRFSFDYNFLSSESPEYVGQTFNDAFTVFVTDASGRRQVAGASVNSSEFHPVSATSVGTTSPFLLYSDIPSGVDTFTPGGVGREVDAGVTDFRRVDVAVTSGVVTIELDVRDVGDGILDSAVIIDNMAFSALELVDPRAGALIDEFGRVVRPPTAALATAGAPVHSVAADGVTQVLLRAKVGGAGTASFSVVGGLASDGSLSANATTLAWGPTVTNLATSIIGGQHYVFALYRSPPDFNRGGDETAKTRTATITMTFTPASGAVVNQSVTIGIGRPPVVVVHDLWSSCVGWIDNPGSIMSREILPQDQPFALTCVAYDATFHKGLVANRTFVAEFVTQALEKQRETGVAVTQVDVIGHGVGGILARRYIDEPSFARFDNFNAGSFNRLILLDTPNLGMRFADETVRMREFSKTRFLDPPANTVTAWSAISAIFEEASINILIDDDDCDAGGCNTTFDELQSNSPLINEIGLNVTPPRSVPYHAIVGTNGRQVRRTPDVMGYSPANIRNLYTRMEDNHPATWNLSAPQRQTLLFDTSAPGLQSRVFCDDPVAGPEDDHDLLVTTYEQAGGLPLPPVGTTPATPWPTTTFPVTSGTASHFRVHANPDHTTRLVQLLNAPVSSGFFSTAMPAPSAVPRVNHCPLPLFESPPILMPPYAPPAPRALVAPTATITAPANGSSVAAGGTVTVTVATAGDGVPSALVLVGSESSLLVEGGPPYSVSFPVPAKALGTMTLKAYAIYPLGGLAISPPITLNVTSTAQLVSLEVLGGDAVIPNVGDTRQLTVLGLYSDGVLRDVSSPARGTLYSRSSLTTVATVSAAGVITASGLGVATIIVRNGTKITSIDVTVKNRPPVPVCQNLVVCNDAGSCTANLPNLGGQSTDADGDRLTFQQVPAGPYPVGEHAVEVRVSDGRATRSCVAMIGVHACDQACLPPPILWGDSAVDSSR